MPIQHIHSPAQVPLSIAEDQIFESSIQEPFKLLKGFKETYDELKRVKRKDPMDWVTNNPLSTHDATKDQQAALRKWFTWAEAGKSPKLNFRFDQLLNNPTVDFSIDNYKALQKVAYFGNRRAVHFLLDKFQSNIPEFVYNQTLIKAASSHNKRLVESLVEKYGIQPDQKTLVSAVRTGDLEITKYLLQKLKLETVNFFTIYSAELSGNIELIKFLNDYNSQDHHPEDDSLSETETSEIPDSLSVNDKVNYEVEMSRLKRWWKMLFRKRVASV